MFSRFKSPVHQTDEGWGGVRSPSKADKQQVMCFFFILLSMFVFISIVFLLATGIEY